VWRNDRWFVGKKKFGVVSHLIVVVAEPSTGKCLKSNIVFTTQCLALKIKDRT
jgi:hypothetical protein